MKFCANLEKLLSCSKQKKPGRIGLDSGKHFCSARMVMHWHSCPWGCFRTTEMWHLGTWLVAWWDGLGLGLWLGIWKVLMSLWISEQHRLITPVIFIGLWIFYLPLCYNSCCEQWPQAGRVEIKRLSCQINRTSNFSFYSSLCNISPRCPQQQPSGKLRPAAPCSVRCCCPLLLRI